MNMSKFLVSSASALAIVGTIGFAVAQTTPATPSASDATANTQASPTTPAAEAMPASPMPNADSNLTPEREARVDRN